MKATGKIYSLAVASLLLAASAFAGGTANKGSLRLYERVNVQGKTIPAGQYRVEWNGTGPNVELNIENGKETIATVPARLVPVASKNQSDGYSATREQDGSSDLTTVFFHGKDFQLQIEAAGTSQPGAASGTN